jgi:hypothetical protein
MAKSVGLLTLYKQTSILMHIYRLTTSPLARSSFY